MKFLLYIFGIILTIPAFATTMCAQDDIIAIVLDPAVSGTRYTWSQDLYEWSTVFPYGTVWGIATCLDVKGATYTAVGEDFRAGDGELVVGGERKGMYCWCQMTHPALSRWVFRGTYGSLDDCMSSCTRYCGNDARHFPTFRAGLFGSLVN